MLLYWLRKMEKQMLSFLSYGVSKCLLSCEILTRVVCINILFHLSNFYFADRGSC